MRFANLLLLVAFAVTAGCDSEGRVRPPPTTVRFFHASPNFGHMALLRERNPVGSSFNIFSYPFGGAVTERFDSGPYDFNLESDQPGIGAVTHVTHNLDLSPAMQYTFVAVSPGDVPQLFVSQVPNLPPAFTNARYSIVDAHPTQGDMDVYLVAPGTLLSSVVPQGNLSFGPTPATFEVTPQVLRLYLTAAGDPTAVLFESTDLTVNAGSDHYFVVHATGGQTPVDFAVSEITGSGLRLNRQGEGALLRVVQAIDDRVARDVILDSNSATPLFSAQPFGELSAYVPISAAVEHEIQLTPVGTPGTEEAAISFTPLAGRYYTAIFAGDTTGGITGRTMIEDPRPIAGQSSLHIINAAGLFDFLNIYVLPPDIDFNVAVPRTALPAPEYTAQRLPLAPGDYEITIQDAETKAVVAGPAPMTFVERGVYGVLMLNAADNVTVDLQHFYDIP